MKRHILSVPVFLLLFAAAATAQMQPPKPAPELAKLEFFVGNWKTEADMKPSSFGPGGKATTVDHIEWMQGRFFLIMHSKYSSNMGSGVEYSVFGYDSKRNVYTYESFNSDGEHEVATGTLDADGKVWTWNSSPDTGGPMKWRFTETVLSPASYSLKFEMAADGKTWSSIMEGKAAKVPPSEGQH
ncbi:MAG: DUF1579 family protein [Acidobacteriaceae bacterium]|nr:DUF1579 family protein [Acidobacteriaceae bacterium]